MSALNKSKRYYFSSADRNNLANPTTDFTIIPTNQIEPNFKMCIVRKLTIPYTIYTINANNNKLYWTDSDSTAITSTLTSGNYDENSLATLIAAQMNADKSSANTYSCSVSTTTAKFTISNGTSNFILRTTVTANSVWQTLGYSTTANKTGAQTYTSDNVYNLQPTKMIYICSNLANGNDSRVRGGDFNIISSLPIAANFGSILTYISSWDDAIDINNTRTQIKFQLRDDNLNIIDLNGQDWSIEIDFVVSV